MPLKRTNNANVKIISSKLVRVRKVRPFIIILSRSTGLNSEGKCYLLGLACFGGILSQRREAED